MADKVIKRLTATNTWAASTDMTPIDIPREGLITEVKIRFNVTATLTAAAYDDYFRRIIQNIKIEGDGGRAYLGMGGTQMSTLLALWNNVVMGIPTQHSNGAGIALAVPDVASASFMSQFVFHPGSNPKDPFDLTAVIPAKALSTLQAKLTSTAAAVTDAAGNITAGTFYYEINQVMANPVPGMMTPLGSTLTYAHTANFSDFGYKFDVPAGAFLRSIIVCTRDDTATVPRRKSDEVTHMRLERPKAGDYLFEQAVQEISSSMASRYGFGGIANETGPLGAIADLGPRPGSKQHIYPAGFFVIDLRPYGHPLYGLDLRGYQTGDYKLACTIANYAAGDSTTIYWDQLQPYAG
jgi:hypothetical protein